MKKLILTFLLLTSLSAATFAQCDKKLVLTSSKTDHLDAAGAIIRTADEKALVEITKTTLDISINDEHKMNGTITDNACNWKVPFKEGKSLIHAKMSNDNGEEKNVTITIEGKDGKVTLLFEMEGEQGDRVKIGIDKFTEKA
jgi:hypothetical protein